jgi:hypothetical protein
VSCSHAFRVDDVVATALTILQKELPGFGDLWMSADRQRIEQLLRQYTEAMIK